jgi:thioredoxin-like negative regulator of GroEL
MYPHERSLVTKLKNKPFALLGVNSDKVRQDVKKVVKAERMTWRSWWNGGGTSGGIAGDWSVTAWPTLYLIDHAGVIRYKMVGAGDLKKLDQQISMLVKDAGAELATHQPQTPAESTVRVAEQSTGDSASSEKLAAAKLNLAKMLADSGKTDKARERYQDIIKKYPNTEAAGEAKELLSQLGK